MTAEGSKSRRQEIIEEYCHITFLDRDLVRPDSTGDFFKAEAAIS
jgi:hypothetical protein